MYDDTILIDFIDQEVGEPLNNQCPSLGTKQRAYLCLIIPLIFGTSFAIYSEMPTSVSMRRMIAPFSSCKGGGVPSREWLGGRIISFVVRIAESGGRSGKVADEADAGPWVFGSSVSVVLSTFNFFNGGVPDESSKDSSRGRGEVDRIDLEDKVQTGPLSQNDRQRNNICVSDAMAAYLNTYVNRAKKQVNPAAKELLETVERKKSNLCVSVDVTSSKDFLAIIETVGPYVCLIKASPC